MAEWISVEERLPAPEEKVICYYPKARNGKGHISIDEYLPITKTWMLKELHGLPSHWMPLPEPPEKEARDG